MAHARRWVGLVLATALLITATGGFSTTSPDRTVDVAIADSEHAFLGLIHHSPAAPAAASNAVTLLTVVNQFDSPITELSITLVETDAQTPPSLVVNRTPGTLDPGESGVVGAVVACGAEERRETVRIEITASGPDVSVSTTRNVIVACRGSA